MSPSKLTSEVWPVADTGQAPADREDYVLVYQSPDPTEALYSGCLYVIASGLSGGERGELAGRYAAQKVMSTYFGSSEPDLGLRLREAIEAANADLYAYAQQRPELVKIGVVIIATAIRGELMNIAQVGDCRAYLIRDGRIQQITRDHTLVQQLQDEGAIGPDEALNHPRRDVLLRTLGTQETIVADIFDTRLRPDDALVLCSNVLPRSLTDDEIVQVAASKAPRNAAEMLVQKARSQGVKQGMTVVAALLRDGAPPLATDIPYTWDGQSPSFDSQPTMMMKRTPRQEQRPDTPPAPQPSMDAPQTPGIDRTSPAAQTNQAARQAPEPTPIPQVQPAPPYQMPVQPAPQYGAQQPTPPSFQAPAPQQSAYTPAPQQPAYPPYSQTTQQHYGSSGYVVDPVTGLPPVPQGQAGWGAQPGGYAPRIYQPPGQPQYRQPRRGPSIGTFALVGLLTVLLVAAMVLVLVNPLGWQFPWAGAVAQAPTATPTTTLSTPTLSLVTTEPPVVAEATTPAVTVTQAAPSGMVLIEGGAFLRGVPDTEVESILLSCYDEDTRPENPGCLPGYFDDAQPVEQVTISPFYIDTTEVTNQAYAACVAAGICTQPDMQEFYSDPNYAEHPVVYVNWDQASAYCRWAGKRLPKEAEWEKAARWDPRSSQSYVYPWGNTFEPNRANTASVGRGGTSPVMEFAQDISPWGVIGMAGNVSEWVSDWYSRGYAGLGALNPSGPPSQPFTDPFRVGRGGSFQSLTAYARAGQRLDVPPSTTEPWLGFRCTADVAGAAPAVTPTSAATPAAAGTPGTPTITPTAGGPTPTVAATTPVP